jgi:hypothetical protein
MRFQSQTKQRPQSVFYSIYGLVEKRLKVDRFLSDNITVNWCVGWRPCVGVAFTRTELWQMCEHCMVHCEIPNFLAIVNTQFTLLVSDMSDVSDDNMTKIQASKFLFVSRMYWEYIKWIRPHAKNEVYSFCLQSSTLGV